MCRGSLVDRELAGQGEELAFRLQDAQAQIELLHVWLQLATHAELAVWVRLALCDNTLLSVAWPGRCCQMRSHQRHLPQQTAKAQGQWLLTLLPSICSAELPEAAIMAARTALGLPSASNPGRDSAMVCRLSTAL
jgi:hypothetical protein